MPDAPLSAGPFRVAELPASRPISFEVIPAPEARAALAEELGATSLKKLRFAGQLSPLGKAGWKLTGTLGATVVQPCVVTLAPVTTRIDTEVERRFVPPERLEILPEGSETEMPEDDTTEPLGEVIDPAQVMAEALALAVPNYPRAPDADFGEASSRPEGAEPIEETEVKPFAGLKALKDRLEGGGDQD
ncbi:YceD family protein [Litorisediminicola beolgyonensis]|uniref:YceD family protein n=1 Tax=Litorisediminicola beolgyonensis TaxID=1173614 RepID=A0ABW3ZFW6_9RHOB